MPEKFTAYYIFYNQHFYSWVTPLAFRTHPLYATIMNDPLFTVYSVTLEY